jgi:hypothetical protein
VIPTLSGEAPGAAEITLLGDALKELDRVRAFKFLLSVSRFH